MILNLPYASLRVFEVTARHPTFSSAAHELGVSQSAISQHVKLLEDWLGQPLMLRGARRSVPTEQGRRLAQAVAKGLGQLSDVCEEIRTENHADNTIVISSLPGFAYLWLFPRLLRFDLAHPDLSVSITTDNGLSEFATTGADIAVRYGARGDAGNQVEFLMDEVLFPVCAPSLIENGPPLNTPSDLANHTILRDELQRSSVSPPSWEYWASENGIELPPTLKDRRFGQSNMVIQAAIGGVGVALGRGPLVIDALNSGQLVRPLPQTAQSQYKYWLVNSEKPRGADKIRLFKDWIKTEVLMQDAVLEVQA